MTAPDGRIELLVLDFHGVCFEPRTGEIDPTAAQLTADAEAGGIATAVLSNELDDRTIASTPLLQQVAHVVSCTTGIQKPDRRAFQRVMLLASADAARTVVVDDAPENVRGAEAAGATAIWFDRTDRAGSWTRVRRSLGLPA